MHLAFLENQKYLSKYLAFYFIFIQSERLGSGKTLSELHIHYEALLTGVYNHQGAKNIAKTLLLP